MNITISLGVLGFFLAVASCQTQNRKLEAVCIQKSLTPDECSAYNKVIHD